MARARQLGRVALLLVTLMVAVVGWQPDLALGSGAAAPSLSISPGTGLSDGQSVVVTGTGFAPGSDNIVYQCERGAVGYVDCEHATAVHLRADAGGRISGEMRVFATLYDWDDGNPRDCRVAGSCVVATNVGFDGGASIVGVDLAFDPDAPLLPPPSITVAPGSDLVDRQNVRVEGHNFFHLGALDPTAPEAGRVKLYQCGQDPEWGEDGDCRVGPTQTVELRQDGSFSTEMPVSAHFASQYEKFDCRTVELPCRIIATTHQPWGGLVAKAELRFDPDAPLPDWPDPAIAASPASELHDTDRVSVQGSGFTPGTAVSLEVCRADDPEACDFETYERPSADSSGDLAAEIPVWASFTWWGSPTPLDCRTAPGCVVKATDLDRGTVATTALDFAPADAPSGRYLDPIFPEVQVDKDVVYRTTTDAFGNPVTLRMDVYRPVGDAVSSRPAIVWMHGGFFRSGDKEAMSREATAFAQRGYVGVSINYRLRPWAFDRHGMYLASLDAYDDALAAVEWLQAHAEEYGIDPDAIAAGGFSAGAVTALNLAYLPGQRGPQDSPIMGVVAESGLLYTAPERGEPPTLAFHGTVDGITPFENIADICGHAAAVDVACQLSTREGYNHGPLSIRFMTPFATAFLAENALGPRGYFDVTAAAGGPYEVDEGASVTLDGSASTGEGVTYSWLPGDRVDLPTSPRPSLAGRDDGVEALELVVTNQHGVSARDTAQVTTRNVAPAVGAFELTPAGSLGASVAGTVTDPGLADTHTATIDWGDGTSSAATVQQGSGTASISGSHDYSLGGEYQVTVRVSDDDAGRATWSGTAAAGCTVTGTSGRDLLVGTAGDDVLCSLGGNDVLVGGNGNDRLFGGPGVDLLLGGPGTDHLVGGPGLDFAVGGGGTNTCEAEFRLSCGRPRG